MSFDYSLEDVARGSGSMICVSLFLTTLTHSASRFLLIYGFNENNFFLFATSKTHQRTGGKWRKKYQTKSDGTNVRKMKLIFATK